MSETILSSREPDLSSMAKIQSNVEPVPTGQESAAALRPARLIKPNQTKSR